MLMLRSGKGDWTGAFTTAMLIGFAEEPLGNYSGAGPREVPFLRLRPSSLGRGSHFQPLKRGRGPDLRVPFFMTFCDTRPPVKRTGTLLQF